MLAKTWSTNPTMLFTESTKDTQRVSCLVAILVWPNIHISKKKSNFFAVKCGRNFAEFSLVLLRSNAYMTVSFFYVLVSARPLQALFSSSRGTALLRTSVELHAAPLLLRNDRDELFRRSSDCVIFHCPLAFPLEPGHYLSPPLGSPGC